MAAKRPAKGAKRTAAPKGKGPRAAKKARPVEPLEPWDQQEGESGPAFAGFVAYRDQPADERSVRKVARSLSKSGSLIRRWSAAHRWVERAKAWDLHQDRARQKALEREQIAAARRHAETSARALRATDRLVEAFLAKLDTKAGAAALRKLSPDELATLAIQAARVQPRIIPAERLSLGLSTTNTGGHDGGPLGDPDAAAKTRSDDELRQFLLGADTARAIDRDEAPA